MQIIKIAFIESAIETIFFDNIKFFLRYTIAFAVISP
jgi:hypothetical protein